MAFRIVISANKSIKKRDIFQDFGDFVNCDQERVYSKDQRYGNISISYIDPLLTDPFEELKNSVSSAILRRAPTPDKLMEGSSSNAHTTGTTPSPPIAKYYPAAKEGTVDIGGVIHLYKDFKSLEETDNDVMNELNYIQTSSSATTTSAERNSIVGILAVPSSMSPSDLLEFIRPALDAISHIRILRDAAPNRYITVIKFKDFRDAIEFKDMYDGTPFSSLNEEICRVVRISSVEIQPDSINTKAFLFDMGINDGWVSGAQQCIELPTCPVCLDRMDGSATGLMTIPCNHSFHCTCLSAWPNSRCPVCRYSLPKFQPESSSQPTVSQSGQTQCTSCGTYDDLWICLICGHVGCGRYGPGHAYRHYEETTHLFSLDLATQRVWDYAGDGYVHRLIQKSDGKVVELPSATSSYSQVTSKSKRRDDIPEEDEEWIEKKGGGPNDEAVALEFSALLASQLDTQRSYYEEKQSDLIARLESLEVVIESQKNLRDREEALMRDNARLEKKVAKSAEIMQLVRKQADEEKSFSRGLLARIDKLIQHNDTQNQTIAALSAENTDLKENVRDLMFFVEAREKVPNLADGELTGGSVGIASPPPSYSQQKKKKKKKEKKPQQTATATASTTASSPPS